MWLGKGWRSLHEAQAGREKTGRGREGGRQAGRGKEREGEVDYRGEGERRRRKEEEGEEGPDVHCP